MNVRYFKKDIMGIIAAVIMVFLLSAVIDTRLDMVVFDRNQKMLEDYERINEAVIRYDQSRLSFRLYNRNRDRASLLDYNEAKEDVSSALLKLSPVFGENEETSMNYRIVSQMLEHRDELIDAYVMYSVQGESLSGDLEYILNLSDRISAQMNSLASSYLKQMNRANEENMLWYQKNQAISNGLTFLILLTLIIMILVLSRKVKGKLLEASGVITEIRNRNFSVKSMERTPYEDVNAFIDTMNTMKDEIRDLILQTQDYARSQIQYEKQKRLLAESRMKALQLQINPHFLFNTLSIVIRHIQFGELETSIKLIKETSKILRSSLGKKEGTIPLDDEIELINAYIFIQQLHLKERVEITLDVRKAYGNGIVEVPALVIQPLVENAVMHGMRETTEGGRIDILIMEKSDKVEVVVKDNGLGIEPMILEKIRSGSYEGHIGLLNVVERLELVYNRGDVFTIESSEGEGTRVTLNLYKGREEDV